MDDVSNTLREHYERTFSQYGPTARGVDWGENQASQLLRYRNMLAVIRAGRADPTFLDVGCGYGGLLQYARELAVPLRYTGIDVAAPMIAWARNAHPDGHFVLGDALLTTFPEPFDYVVCNGILTQKLAVPGLAMDAFAHRLIRRLFDACRVGIAFNVMTTKVNYFAEHLYYRNPAELLSWCLCELTRHVRLDHAYQLYEYTVYLYRDGPVD